MQLNFDYLLYKKLVNKLFGAFLVNFFGHKKISQAFYT